MGTPLPDRTQVRVVLVALPVAVVALAALAVLLGPGRPEPARLSASAVAFLLAGLATAVACSYRARQCEGRHRLPWRLFTLAAVVALVANVVGSVGRGDGPTLQPTAVADTGIMVALLLTIVGLAAFPGVRRRGSDLVMSILDGLVAGGGMLAIVAVLVYPELLATAPDDPVLLLPALAIPVLDVVLLTLALIWMMRATGRDRPVMMLVAAGFILYGVSDLVYAVEVARGEFAFGTRLDLGWVVGYVLVIMAALVPRGRPDDAATRVASADTRGSVLVFGVLLVAGGVQVSSGEPVTGPSAVLWLVLVLLAGARQAVLSHDNTTLREGLEDTVDAQTADLRRLARENALLLASVGDGIYGVDRDGLVTFVNPAAAAALGRRPRDLLGRDAHEVFHDDHTAAECYVARVVASGTAMSELEDAYARSGGEPFRVEVTVNPVPGEDGEAPRGAVVVFRDVTARREVERMKNEFLSVVSHELRTPLTSIRGSLGLLAGGAVGALEPRAADMVRIASESSERLTRLINDLLDVERIAAGGRAVRVTTLDAHEVVRDAVAQIQGAAMLEDVRVLAGPCDGVVLGDGDQIMQTLTNLLGNAIKFSDPGAEVTASAEAEDGHVVFRVRDHGRGIPTDQLAHVFEPFAQVDSSDAREKGGTGLGLTISRAIVERHGGRIWAESREGHGTTMSFTVPAALDPALARSRG